MKKCLKKEVKNVKDFEGGKKKKKKRIGICV